ncbi:class I adenylate-forming enzyme family protein [Peterkaempfera bronchialis]|uniref:Long-chain fatty acid--CoA ligase n=1 Tax=Peterkaempfera bronchialis TaxID=2126346 RepID=A0A345SYR0_9ACTN|nr:fatty acid--CoA ligase family protein [Peterkaempfera bronchialis]AXI78865.1 long-chain fatty acid--CoA ligase [Peterkaempfera bronchialis]
MSAGELYAAFRAVAQGTPSASAVIGYDGTASSYQALLGAVDAAADRLAADLVPGDVLGLAVDDPFAFLSLYLAAARLGTVTVLLDSRLSAQELEHSAARFDLGRVAVDQAPPARPGAFAWSPVGEASLHRSRALTGYAHDDSVVHCTSGSTGVPKGIVMSQAAIMARVRLWGGELNLSPADVVLCALPLAHCHGIDVLTLPTLLTGGTVVFARGGQLTARGLARHIRTHGVTVMSGLPVMYQMLTAARGVPPTALRTLRLAISGSAPLAVATQQRFLERYGLPLRQVYGLSEIAVICFDKAYAGNGSIGKPIAGVEWRLEPVPVRGAGQEPLYELYVRGPALARGYYRDPAADAEMFEDGWLRTRDVIQADAEGWYIRGRQSGFVNVAGNKVGPLEVEAALRECAGVVEAAVVGTPDAESTERIAALVVADGAFELGTVKRQLSGRLLSYQLPQRYQTTTALPRTPLGKIDYAAVKRLMDSGEAAVT